MSWIQLHRKTKENWIWSDPKKFQWWVDILMTVNFTANKLMIKGEVIDCKRGQSVRSLDTWATEWKTTKKTVSNFFKLLQKENMIRVENLRVTTRITVCKYDSYNSSVNADYTAQDTQTTTHTSRRLPPINNDKEYNNDKEVNNSAEFSTFWEMYGKKSDREKCCAKFTKLTPSEITHIFATLPTYIESTPDIKFRKNPLTYLNGKCWNDTPITPQTPKREMVY